MPWTAACSVKLGQTCPGEFFWDVMQCLLQSKVFCRIKTTISQSPRLSLRLLLGVLFCGQCLFNLRNFWSFHSLSYPAGAFTLTRVWLHACPQGVQSETCTRLLELLFPS